MIHNNCYVYDKCLFNDDNSACGYTLFVCSTSFIACVIFLLFGLIVDNVDSKIRKNIVMVDFVYSGKLENFLFFLIYVYVFLYLVWNNNWFLI